MHLKDLFRPTDLVLEFAPMDKWAAIESLVDHLVADGRIDAEGRDEIFEQVIERERSMSTGMERGIAIPHAAVDGLSEVAACLGIVSREGGLAFESVDGQPAHLIVLLLIPRAQKLLHIRTLAHLGLDLRGQARRGLERAGRVTGLAPSLARGRVLYADQQARSIGGTG